MAARSLVVVGATLLHGILGFSGLSVGLTLAAALADGSGLPAGVRVTALDYLVPAGLVAYGAGDVVGALGIWGRRAWGRWLAIGVDVLGLLVLAISVATIGLDPMLVGGAGVVVLAAALAWLTGSPG